MAYWYRQLNYILRGVMMLGIGLGLQSFWANPPVSITTNFNVTKIDDTNDGVCDADCSLREAIIAANAQPGADSVIVPAGIYTLTIPGTGEDAGATGDLDITDDLTLTGVSAETTVIDGAGIDLVVEVTGTVTPTVVIDRVAIRGGYNPAASGLLPAAGGILNHGTLTLIQGDVISNTHVGLMNVDGVLNVISSTISENMSTGIGNIRGTATIQDSVIQGNACNGLSNILGAMSIDNSQIINHPNPTLCYPYGGVYGSGGNLTLTNSLLVNNRGGLFSDDNGDGVFNISNSVFLSNTAPDGGGVHVFSGILNITNTLFSGNHSSGYGSGGAVYHGYKSASIHNSTFTSNTAGLYGGAIYSFDYLTITNSLFVGNQAEYGGGAAVLRMNYNVTNSTFSGNQTKHEGGGLMLTWNYGNLMNHLGNLTIVGNVADSDQNGVGNGGGIYITDSGDTPGRFVNSLIAGNIDTGGEAPDCGGALVSDGYNLIQDPTGCIISGTLTGLITNMDPLLGPLQDNGGNTLTHALLPGSPAIDAGNPTGCEDTWGLLLLTDQRGYARHINGGSGAIRCDMGAYEYNSFLVTATPTPTSFPSPTRTPSPTGTLMPTSTPSPTGTPNGGQSALLYLPVIRHGP